MRRVSLRGRTRSVVRFGSFASLVLLAAASALAHDDENKEHNHEHAEPVKFDDAELYRPTAVPDRIMLSWSDDPSRTQSVTWRTDSSVHRAFAEYALATAGPEFRSAVDSTEAETVLLESDLGAAHYHTAHFKNLEPDTKYVYRVGDGVNFSEWNHFHTASEEAKPFSFVYFGDAQNDVKSMWSRVIREAYSDAPKARFFLHAGDLINRANRDAEWGEWFYAGGWIHSTIPCIATPGNHEYAIDESRRYGLSHHWRPQFALPDNGPEHLTETVYTLVYQGVRIVSLNSNEKPRDQIPWLERVLAENTCRWIIVTHHHPLYAAKPNRDNSKLREMWQPIYDRYGVDLVLQGHDHSYARSRLMTAAQNSKADADDESTAAGTALTKNESTGVNLFRPDAGTVYVVSVSGPKMYDVAKPPYVQRVAEDTQLYQIITVDGDELRYEARTAIGDVYDAFTLVKRPNESNELIEHAPDSPERRRLREDPESDPTVEDPAAAAATTTDR